MKLKDVIKSVCDEIGFDDVLSALNSDSEIAVAVQNKIDKLVKYFNKIQEEIASEFLPVYHEENLSYDNALDFSDLEEQILDVVYIKNEKGKKMNFTVFPDHVSFDGKMASILYTFIPEAAELNDDILFLVPLRAYVYAVSREHYLNEGLLEEATRYEERFKNLVDSLLEKDKEFSYKTRKVLPRRKWL